MPQVDNEARGQSPNAVNHHTRCSSPKEQVEFILLLLHSKDSQRYENNTHGVQEQSKKYKNWCLLIFLLQVCSLNSIYDSQVTTYDLQNTLCSPSLHVPCFPTPHQLLVLIVLVPPRKAPKPKYDHRSLGKGAAPRLQRDIFTTKQMHIAQQT